MGDKILFLLAFGCDGDLAWQTTTIVCSMPNVTASKISALRAPIDEL
jgi:hypothetical protein